MPHKHQLAKHQLTKHQLTMKFFLCLVLLVGAAVATAGRHREAGSKAEVSCDSPFHDVGGKCIFIDATDFSTWAGMRSFCQSLGADLIKLDSGDLFADLIRYIHANVRPDFYYWIGATDAGHEGSWTWTDGSAVQMGTPFWANAGCDNVQMPDGSETENCAILDPYVHLYFRDVTCDYDEGYAICEK